MLLAPFCERLLILGLLLRSTLPFINLTKELHNQRSCNANGERTFQPSDGNLWRFEDFCQDSQP